MFDFIKRHPREYQAHLERISDFLLVSNSWKETDNGIEFLDIEGDWTKSLHHFRSTSLSSELRNVKECWAKCKKENNLIPAYKIFDDNGKSINLSILKSPPSLFTAPFAKSFNTPNTPPMLSKEMMSPIFPSPSTIKNTPPLSSTQSSSSVTPTPCTIASTPRRKYSSSTPLAVRSPKKTSTVLVKVPRGNTAKVLLAVLPGMSSEVGRYAELKEKCKKNSTNLYLDEFKILSSEISTKLQMKHHGMNYTSWKKNLI